MKIPNVLPITAEQSRAARFQLGLTQAELIANSELPGWKLKQFETGRFVPDIPFLESLRDYFQEKGIQFGDQPTARLKTATNSNHAESQLIGQQPRMGFFVTDEVPADVVQSLLERMTANDERIGELMDGRVESGWFSEFDEDTEAKVRQLAAALAENYILFCSLQGRNPLIRPAKGHKTLADVIASVYVESPAFALINGPHDADGSAEEAQDTEGVA
ncbi:hypothetical protein [Denitromonas iodatirespirans]|uniref:Uncharacterized protein n=1 Tax=Denitromonas iodatirespirans TaxID=2795389 RepID=A0A944D8I0_DENI1|nr:hypothetical protein [Denitromonas iodatirespirans]MBT0962055.1 hypothetical protein [Denitromonas iodatirespirans]